MVAFMGPIDPIGTLEKEGVLSFTSDIHLEHV